MTTRKCPRWKPWQDAMLRELYPQRSRTLTARTIGERIGHSVSGVYVRARRQGLAAKHPPRRKWQPEHDGLLRQWWGKMPAKKLARMVGHPWMCVHQRAGKLDLTRDRRMEYGPEFEKYMRENNAAGWSDADIAAGWGGCRDTASKYRRKFGLPCNAYHPRQIAKIKRANRQNWRAVGNRQFISVRMELLRVRAAREGWATLGRHGAVCVPIHTRVLNALEGGPKSGREIRAVMGLRADLDESTIWTCGRNVLKEMEREKLITVGKRNTVGTGWVKVYTLAPGVHRRNRMEDAA